MPADFECCAAYGTLTLPASPPRLQVEDMLKRSFAEFHAQKREPELMKVLEAGQRALRRLRAQPWPRSPLGTTREDLERYYKICAEIEDLGSSIEAEV